MMRNLSFLPTQECYTKINNETAEASFPFCFNIYKYKIRVFYVDKVFSLIKSQKTGKSVMCGGGLEPEEWVF